MRERRAEKNPPAFLGTRDAAAALRIDTTTLLALEKRGVLSPAKTSTGRRLYAPQDLAAVRAYQRSSGRGART